MPIAQVSDTTQAQLLSYCRLQTVIAPSLFPVVTILRAPLQLA